MSFSRESVSRSDYQIPTVIGVVHLLPLPGSPRFGGSLDEVIDRSILDCSLYSKHGLKGAIIENFGDNPFTAGKVDPVTVASMTRVAIVLKEKFPDLVLGINVLRNDAESALSIATVVGADFIRVNVHVGAVVADQGVIQGKAYDTLRLKKNLNASVRIFADVEVKHAAAIGRYDIEMQAADALERGLADAIIISGARTGKPVDMKQLRTLRKLFPDGKIIIGSGANSRNARQLLKIADSIIIGTAVKFEGVTSNPVDENLLKEFVALTLRSRS